MQASNPGRQEGNAGSYRATFEDKPLMSDVVFLRAWVAVDLPRFYNPVTNLLSARPQAPKPQQEVKTLNPKPQQEVKTLNPKPQQEVKTLNPQPQQEVKTLISPLLCHRVTDVDAFSRNLHSYSVEYTWCILARCRQSSPILSCGYLLHFGSSE